MAEAARQLNEKWWNYRRYEAGDREPSLDFILAAKRLCGIAIEDWSTKRVQVTARRAETGTDG